MTAQPYVSPRLASALALAAMALQSSRGRKRADAEDKLGRVLLAINGAPFGFKGVLTPDRPPWPLPEVDPIIVQARTEFGEPDASPAPDRMAIINAAFAVVDANGADLADAIEVLREALEDAFPDALSDAEEEA
jgi:hypothetical protein